MIKAMVITTSGYKTLPSDLIEIVKIIAIGGGGAGHGFYNTASTGGSGGGGGGYSIANSTSIPNDFKYGTTPSFYVQVGAGGAFNSDYYFGPNGEDTWLRFTTSSAAPTSLSQGILARGGRGGSLFGQGGLGGGSVSGSANIGETTYNGGRGGIGTALNGGGGGGGAGGPNATGGSGGFSGILFYNMSSGYSPGGGGGGGGSGYNTGATTINNGSTISSPSFYPTTSLKGGANGGGVFPRNGIGGIFGTSIDTSIPPTTREIATVDTEPLGLRGGGGGGGGGVLYATTIVGSAPGAAGSPAAMIFINQTINNVLTVTENYSGGGGGGGGGGGTITAAFAVNAPSCGSGGPGGLYGGGGGGGNFGGAGANGVVVIIYKALAKKLWAEAETGTIIIGRDDKLGEPGVRPPVEYITTPLDFRPNAFGDYYTSDLNFSTNLTYLRARTKVTLSSATFPALATDSISWDENAGGCH